ncbi:GSCFA family protein [Cyclobacterium lianum]|uniref:GSCFA family protein n=1 Tax=Cyclobacterium lianum TaxID=388280 RepID=A0A1M7QHL2_9BACT|nr:GSCFA domain-containing protein [Cyclobacterium lianum]SHN30380.1 GSCFA family protein [Cyclobacterium lianum]
MKSFRTEFSIDPSPHPIRHSDRLITMGSCFSEVIGEKLTQSKFPVLVNPFGIIYNPISIFELLSLSLRLQKPETNLYLSRHGRNYHFQFHSRIHARSREDLEDLIQRRLQEVYQMFSKCSQLMITLGTAFVFRHLSTGRIVANCHKQPSKQFQKERLSLDQILAAFDNCYRPLKKCNPDIRIVLTVSPVRHVKDGIPQNQVSKSLLRLFCDEVVKRYEDIYYFPAYELQMDDLRDYRFYKDDLIHPNATAENYIWEKFRATFFEQHTLDILSDLDQVRKNLNHRPFDPLSEAHFHFLNHLLQKIDQMPSELNFSEERNGILAQLQQIEAYLQHQKLNPGNESKQIS